MFQADRNMLRQLSQEGEAGSPPGRSRISLLSVMVRLLQNFDVWGMHVYFCKISLEQFSLIEHFQVCWGQNWLDMILTGSRYWCTWVQRTLQLLWLPPVSESQPPQWALLGKFLVAMAAMDTICFQGDLGLRIAGELSPLLQTEHTLPLGHWKSILF